MEKSDEIWRIKHVRKFDEENFDELNYVSLVSLKIIFIVDLSRGHEGWEMYSFSLITVVHGFHVCGSQLLLESALYNNF